MSQMPVTTSVLNVFLIYVSQYLYGICILSTLMVKKLSHGNVKLLVQYHITEKLYSHNLKIRPLNQILLIILPHCLFSSNF